MRRPTEAALVGTAGAGLAGLVGSLVGLALPAAVIGGANGAISGWRRVYRWASPIGWLAFVLDSTWALVTTTGATLSHLISAVRRDDSYIESLSERQNRHVYGRGLRFRRGFAITIGNTVSGAGDVDHPHRARLVTDHENVHVWQTRWFGPLFPALYASWMAAGGAVGALRWLTGRRGGSFNKTVESYAYYLNPFEWWAYSRDANWPPHGLVDGIGPRRPMVRSFADRRCQESDGLTDSPV